MAAPPMTLPMSETDYEAIESAVMETARGQWFLAEYARRTRQAETDRMHEVLQRIEDKIDSPARDPHFERVQMSIMEMAQAIARTKDEIAAIKPTQEVDGRFGEATEELDAIVTTTESATGDILHAAEQIQEVAWTLRERGFEGPICDLLDERATDIYTACSFQDLTGQRTRKVIGVLRYLEARINAMIDIWGLDGAPALRAGAAARAAADVAEKSDAPLGRQLAHGPALPGMGLEQTSIDAMLGGLDTSGPDEDLDFVAVAIDDADFASFEPAAAADVTASEPAESEPVESEPAAPEDTKTDDESAIVEAVVETIKVDDIEIDKIEIDKIDLDDIELDATEIGRFNIDTVEVPAIEMDLVAVDVDLPAEDAGLTKADDGSVKTAAGDMPPAVEAPSIAAGLDDRPFAHDDSVADDVVADGTPARDSADLRIMTAPLDSLVFDIVAIDAEPLEDEPSAAAPAEMSEPVGAEADDQEKAEAEAEETAEQTAAVKAEAEADVEAGMAPASGTPSLAPDQPAARLSTADIDRLTPVERIALFS
ncbi:hypothetical protein [Blastochloris sulfoviridis]|uniref:Chemotaxis protein CheZ n=1 Tax=Blastochloris sulfoviridis TaxID=50712 RepID=A0A5M6HR25_9HYPH|nr:hypothetical protein [Blastochloris sulfoviridis]KAA5598147.1 hypothetical protein F1193_13950 [Blastochloris sulfoviridis]